MKNTSSDTSLSDQTMLPIVDLSPFFNGGTQAAKQSTADKLVAACKDVGFVYVKGHGVPGQLLEEAFSIVERFYDLPTEEKMKAPHPPGWAVHRGYSWPGLEKVSNATNGDDEEDLAEKLREVQDFKVSEMNAQMEQLTRESGKL